MDQSRVLFDLRQEHLSIIWRKRRLRRLRAFLAQGKLVFSACDVECPPRSDSVW